ncbi:calcium-binding protein [Motilimonas sp. KMU-193]|uniref:calcium-binding protein n=1 Tax=Motilimonas sp. KMU-193 TaxID=3388668 RepID=UPI00396B1701
MEHVYVGTTNLDSTGSATNLNESNAAKVIKEGEIFYANEDYQGGTLNALVINDAYGVNATSFVQWNDRGTKEIKIDASDKNILVHNFVDVDINAQDSTNGLTVQVTHAKRGEIETGAGDDVVHISLFSNNTNWVNQFNVSTNAGNDRLTIDHLQNTQFTAFYIDTGTGDDNVDLSSVHAQANVNLANRIIELGEGNDTLIASQGNDVINGGLGADKLQAGYGDDTVLFDANDQSVDGGEGFDALVTQHEHSNVVLDDRVSGFEAVVGGQGLLDDVTVSLGDTDGLFVAALGNDSGDVLNIEGGWQRIETSEITELTAAHINILSQAGANTDSLQAYVYELDGQQTTVWTDLDLASIL